MDGNESVLAVGGSALADPLIRLLHLAGLELRTRNWVVPLDLEAAGSLSLNLVVLRLTGRRTDFSQDSQVAGQSIGKPLRLHSLGLQAETGGLRRHRRRVALN